MTAIPPDSEDAVQKALTLAETLRHLGWHAKAEESYRTLLRDHPAQPEALYQLALLRDELKDREEAMRLVAAAIAADPEDVRFHVSLGRMLALSTEVTASADRYRRAVALEPTSTDVLVRLGSLRFWEERYQDAAAIFEWAHIVDPEEPTVLCHIGSLYLTIGRPEAAEHHLRKALSLNDAIADAYVTLGKALRVQKRHEDEAAAYERAVALQPDKVEGHIGLAVALVSLGRKDEAVKRLCAAAVDMAQNPAALHPIGRQLLEQGQDDAAKAVYRRFAAVTTERHRFPGGEPCIVTIRSAAEACRRQGWPYRTVAPSRPIQVTGGDGALYEYTLPEAFLAYAEDVVLVPRVQAPLTGGDTLMIDGFSTNSRTSLTLVPNFVWHTADDRMLLDLPEPARVIEEEAILLGGGPNWSHGVLDWSSKLAVLEHAAELSHLPVLISGDTLRSIVDLLELLGVDRSRMVMLPPGEVVRARKLWLPSLTHNFKFVSPMQVEFLRRRLSPLLEAGQSGPRRRLFLSRRKAGYRALVNEAEVLEALAPLGIELSVPEELPMAEQIKLFASAELILQPAGGGSAACVFARKDAAYLELTHNLLRLPNYAIVTGLVGQRFRHVVGETCRNRSPYAFDHDFVLSPEEVAAAAREALGLH